jgi:uncharacterized RDD family membrane protein YckC
VINRSIDPDPAGSPEPTGPAPVPAGLGQRAIARCIDMVVLLLLITGAFAGFAERDANDQVTFDVPPWWIALVLVGVLSYEIVPVVVRGQTPGKILTRIRVAQVSGGGNPTWTQSARRWIVPVLILLALSPLLETLVFPLLAIVYGTALLDRGGRSLLDKLAGTRVVQTR